MAYKSSGPKGSQTAKDRKAGDVGAKGGIGGGRQGGNGKDSGGRPARSVGNATVADHAIATGRVSAPSVPSGGVARGNYNSQVDAYNDYAKAVGGYATRGFVDKALDFLGGSFYDAQEPMAGNPRSFAGGDYHSTSNPGGILGGVAGMAIPGLGTLTGPALGAAYTASGLPEVWHGGLDQPDLRGGLFGNTTNPMGGTQAAANSQVNGGGWFDGKWGGGGYSPFGGQVGSRSTRPLTASRPSAPQAVTSSLPASSFNQPKTSQFSGFPDYGSYSPFGKSNWSWG